MRKALVGVALTAALAALVVVPLTLRDAEAGPIAPQFEQSIDGYSPHQPQTGCDLNLKPGVAAVRDMLDQTYGWHQSWWYPREGCGALYEHRDGRALDYMLNINNSAHRAIADDFLGWLLATDLYGNRHAMARRLGVMYVIWGTRIWKSYQANSGWQYYGGIPHNDHIHISFGWAGARMQTSYWTGAISGPGTDQGSQAVKYGPSINLFYRGTNGAVQQNYTTNPWSGWSGIPGTVDGNPVAVPYGDSINVFARAADGTLQQTWTAPGRGWAAWHNMGGSLTGDPSAVTLGNSINVFARGTNGKLMQRYVANGVWSNWAPIEPPSGGFTGDPSAIRFANSINLFVRGNDGKVYQMYSKSTGGWSAWASLDGAIAGNPVAVPYGSSSINLFGRGTDGKIYQRWADANGWNSGGWVPLGGSFAGDPVALKYYDGINLFARGTDNKLYQAYTAGGGWSAWRDLGGPITSN